MSTVPAMLRPMAEHYFSAQPTASSQRTVVPLRLPGLELKLWADRGVFSSGRVDPGTLTLLKEAPPPPAEGDLLDLGCGYGPIACALAARSPGATVWATDVNTRALELTADNAAQLGLPNVRATAPDDLPGTINFAGIWSNPPIRVGKPALHDLLARWLGRLAPGGAAWLVVNRHLGSDSLSGWMTEQGWAVEKMASKSGYRVLKVTAA